MDCSLASTVVYVKYTEYCLVKFMTLLPCFGKKIRLQELTFVSERPLSLYEDIQRYVITVLYQQW